MNLRTTRQVDTLRDSRIDRDRLMNFVLTGLAGIGRESGFTLK